MAAFTIHSDFGAQENSLSLFPLLPHIFAMRWWDRMPWSLFFEWWVLSQLLPYIKIISGLLIISNKVFLNGSNLACLRPWFHLPLIFTLFHCFCLSLSLVAHLAMENTHIFCTLTSYRNASWQIPDQQNAPHAQHRFVWSPPRQPIFIPLDFLKNPLTAVASISLSLVRLDPGISSNVGRDPTPVSNSQDTNRISNNSTQF